jgi:heparan-alpha-glucosaminide N-acetyltransferase
MRGVLWALLDLLRLSGGDLMDSISPMPTLIETNQPGAAAGTASDAKTPAAGERSFALDAYRGLIMVLLISHGFGLSALRDHPIGKYLAAQVDHVPWEGLVLWDLIQPAFMFMVGVAMPYAFARRQETGGSYWTSFAHAAWRSAVLIFLSQLFVAVQSSSGQFQFGLINVLSQIAFTYLICFLLMRFDFLTQVAAAVGLLAAHWLLFLQYPGPGGAFSQEGNVGQAIDQWLLGRNYSGYYVTINFLSSAVTTMSGVWAGMLMRRPLDLREKLRILLWWAGGCLAGGMLLSLANPMVKRLWTASFTIYSAGFVLLGLAAMLWMVDGRGWRRLTLPLVWVGTNSLFIYCVSQMCRGGISRGIGTFTGRFAWLGTEMGPIMHECSVLAVMWWVCRWMYQRKAFVKI